MGDSDDEYDRRRGRDKFRRERNDYNEGGRTNINRRDDWPENNWQRDRNQGRRDYRENYTNRLNYVRNDRYSPADRSGDLSPSTKRFRPREWDDRLPNYELGGGYHSGHQMHHRDNNWSHDRERDDEMYQPPLMTLKQFVNDQDDNLDGEVLIAKYNEYKTDFKRTQIQEFFNRHKDEEWFRCKYFPDEIEKRKDKQKETYQRRLNVFMELWDLKFFENVFLDVDKADEIVRVLDAAVIKLEGGTDFDLQSLDENLENLKNKDSLFVVESSSTTKASTQAQAEKNFDSNEASETSQQQLDEENVEKSRDQKSLEENENKLEDGEASNTPKQDLLNEESNDGELMEEGEEVNSDFNREKHTENADAGDLADEKPRALHKTCSIFFRNLAPSITRQEIEDECRKFPGFLRLAISEPQIDKRFNRRGWATYERTVNIREICWNLNYVKIRGTELGPIVNRDLARRIRSVNGTSSHKTVVRSDIRHAAKLIMKLDAQKNLWQDENQDENHLKNGLLSAISLNPLLKNIAEYLIEEAPAEEAELLGTSVEDPLVSEAETLETNGTASTPVDGTSMERDDNLIKVLDRLLFYLRIVHSIDYYNHCEYPNEDEMPNRIGLVHARGLFSSARVAASEIAEYLKEQENKIQPLLQSLQEITEAEAKKLGLKNIEEAIEAFIKENTKELGEGKWLCPLSNKKFMGPEYVRKHILNKYTERIDQVKADTVYFNNYLYDPKRPQLMEHPLNRPPQQQPQQLNQVIRPHDQGPFGGHGFNYNSARVPLLPNRYPYMLPPQDPYVRQNFKRKYRDLDAPTEE